MKARINYKSKKTIIIIAIAVVLLIAAITGTVAYIKGNNNAAAAMENTEVTEPANNGNDSNNNGGVENPNTPNTDNPEQIPIIDDNQNPTTPAQNGDTTTNPGTTTNQGTTTGTTTGNAGTTVPDTEYTQTTVVENPWKTEDITWAPISLQARTETAGLNINTPDLEVTKTAYVGNQAITAEQTNTVVQPGQEITYVIRIKNAGNLPTSTIRTIDAIPEGTELVEGTISEGGELVNGKITWKNVIAAGETVELSFKVKVISEKEITLISNTAKVNGEDTPTTETPVVTTAKEAYLVVDGELAEATSAKVGDTLRYVITITNNSNVPGKTTVTDTIPDGTEIIDGTISEDGKLDGRTITWNDVAVKANGETTVSFDVIINKETAAGEVVKEVTNAAVVGEKETPQVITPVANITGKKEANKTEAKVGDTLTYTITLTNSGNAAGTVTVTDEIPEGTSLVAGSITGNGAESNGTITWNVVVPANDKVSVSFKVTVNATTSTGEAVKEVTNTAVVDGENTPQVTTPVANITGKKEADKTEAKVGDTLIYTITLTNSGNAAGTVTVTDEIPAGTRIKDPTIDGYDATTNTMTWSNVTVPANGKAITLTLEVIVEGGVSEITNVAQIDNNEIPDRPETVVKYHYTIEHYIQGLDENFELKDTETSGEVLAGTETSYTANDYTGFTFDDDKTENKGAKVPTNNNLVIKLYYTRNSYKVTYKYEGTTPNGASALPTEKTYKYGASVTVAEDATAPGYKFSGWDHEDFTMPAEDVVIKGSFEARNDTKYRVEHYLENLNSEGFTLEEGKDYAATTDTKVTAEPKEYPGFTFDSTVVGTKTEGTVTGDGQLVLKLYYTRNSYKVTYKYEGTTPNGASALPTEKTYKYGASVTVAEDATAPGYKFSGWDHEDFTMPAEDVVIKGSFEARNDTKYRVEHYLENLDGKGFTLEEGKDYAATTDTKVTAEPKEYPGFTFDSTVVGTKTEGTVTGDGQLVLKLYYTRNSYKVTYKYEGTTPNGASALPTEKTYKYGASVTVAEDATAPGYKFSGWDHEDFTMPAEDVVIKGSFEARNDTKYRVEHYLENLDGKGFTLEEGKDYAATTDTKVTAEPKEYPGFTFDSTVVGTKTEGTVTGDGQLVLKLYYTRNSYKVTYKYEGTTPNGASALPTEKTYKYGASVTVAEDATAPGYKFSGWDHEDFTMPAEDVVIKGSFEARNDTKYRVEHYLENLDGKGFTLEEGKDYAATTDTKVTAEPKEYPGFTFDSTVVGTKTEGTVTGDGQLVLRLYYVRATYTYTIHYFYNGVEDEEKQEGPFQAKFGEKVNSYRDKSEEGKYTQYDITSSNKTEEAILVIGTGANFINVYYGTPEVSINKDVSLKEANVGDTLYYTIKVSENRKLVNATNIKVTDNLPSELYVIEDSITSGGKLNDAKTEIEWNIKEIEKGKDVELKFTAIIKPNSIGKTISNTAELGGSASGKSTVETKVAEIQALTHELTPGQTGKDAANIVLVMDLSSSMNEVIKSEFVECTHTRTTKYGREYCPEGCRQDRYSGVWGQWKNTTRLDAAKEAAQKFVNTVYAKKNESDPDSKATITVITFNQENYNWYDSKYVGTRVLTFGSNNEYTTATVSNYNELVTEIGNIDIGTQTSGLGTHIRAALDKAYNTIYGANGIAKTYPNNSNYVIFLGDGDPTTSYNNNNKDSIDTSAQQIKDAGATIYSIGFGEDISDQNSTGYKILESISSEKKVYTANDSVTLTQIFTNLAGGMTEKPSSTEEGKIVVKPEKALYFNTADGKEEYITVKYKGETLIECKSQEELDSNKYLTYSEGILTFNVNEWNSVEENTKILTGGEDLVLNYYVAR